MRPVLFLLGLWCIVLSTVAPRTSLESLLASVVGTLTIFVWHLWMFPND